MEGKIHDQATPTMSTLWRHHCQAWGSLIQRHEADNLSKYTCSCMLGPLLIAFNIYSGSIQRPPVSSILITGSNTTKQHHTNGKALYGKLVRFQLQLGSWIRLLKHMERYCALKTWKTVLMLPVLLSCTFMTVVCEYYTMHSMMHSGLMQHVKENQKMLACGV